MSNRYRAKFVNSLSGFKSANLIGTCDKEGKTNLGIFSSLVHLGASPALVGFIMRPDNETRHTLNNIIETQIYTINHVSSDFYLPAHQSSARYQKSQSEFKQCGLIPEYIDNIDAPFVKESKLKYAVKLQEVLPITLNNTQFIIGEIFHIVCENNIVKKDGYIDIESINTVTVSSLDSYHTTRRLSRLSYAKPDIQISQLSINGEIENG